MAALSALLHVCGWLYPRAPGPLMPYHVLSFSFPLTFPTYGREFHTIKCECNEFCHVFDRIIFFTFTHPVFPTGPVRSQFIPDASSIVPPPLMFPPRGVARVLFHSWCLRGLPPFRTSPSKTCVKVSITALGLSSQTHLMALHILHACGWSYLRVPRPLFSFQQLSSLSPFLSCVRSGVPHYQVLK